MPGAVVRVSMSNMRNMRKMETAGTNGTVKGTVNGTAGINKTPVTSETAEAHDETTKKEVSVCASTRIRNLRSYLALSQAAFSKPLKLSPTHIARFEKGVSIPAQETIKLICEVYGVDPSVLT